MTTSNGSIPVYIFDEHNEAFYYWNKAKYEGFIKEPIDLFHVDAHDDMGRPESFQKSIYFPRELPDSKIEYYRDFANTDLNIGNFIVPAVLVGLIRNVYFIYPQWRKLKPHRKRLNVSSVFGEGKMLKYGMKPTENMEETSRKALPDLKYYNFSMMGIDKIPQNRKVILDIDLDYFACRDSVLNQYQYELEITPQQFHNREKFLGDRTLPFAAVKFTFVEQNGKLCVQVAHKQQKELSYLPSKDEISSEITTLMNTLSSRKIRPKMVTISRSSISGFCPKEYVELIETELSHKLKQFLDA
jgi:hypothetical protein